MGCQSGFCGVVGEDVVGPGEPFFRRGLRCHSAFDVGEGHAAEEEALHPGPEWGVDNDSRPAVTHEVGEQRHFNDYVAIANHLLDPVLDDGMGHRLEGLKLVSVVEDDRRQLGPIDLAVG